MQLCTIIVLLMSLLADEAKNCPNDGAYYSKARCVLTPEETEGPYYIPYHLLRSDIREGKPGLKLEVKFTICDERCQPLPNVTVDIWQCDQLGYYSGYTKYDPNITPPSVDHATPTDNTTFMRGIQISDDNGVVEFVTNFPGWYYGRTIHIHIEVFKSGTIVHTGQIYFPDSLSDKIAQMKPYSEHKFRRYRNDEDRAFTQQFGNETIIVPKPIDENKFETGIKAEMFLIVKS